MKTVWKGNNIKLDIKVQLLITCVFSELLYAAERWTINKTDEKRTWHSKTFATDGFLDKLARSCDHQGSTPNNREASFLDDDHQIQETEAVWTCYENALWPTSEGDFWHGRGSQTSRKTSKRLVDDITDWC